MFSVAMAHFWLATIGIVLYIAAMWIAGVTEGADVARDQPRRHADLPFVESVKAIHPFWT